MFLPLSFIIGSIISAIKDYHKKLELLNINSLYVCLQDKHSTRE